MHHWSDVSGKPALHKSKVTLHDFLSFYLKFTWQQPHEQSKVYLYRNTQATLEDTTLSPKHVHTRITLKINFHHVCKNKNNNQIDWEDEDEQVLKWKPSECR